MPRSTLDSRFYWSKTPQYWIFMWGDGITCGTVDREGNWRVDWRGHRHAGWLPSVRMAKRSMERWFAARQGLPTLPRRSKHFQSSRFWWPVQDFLAGHLGASEDSEELEF